MDFGGTEGLNGGIEVRLEGYDMLFIMKTMMVQKALHVATARKILFINMLKVTDGDKLHNDNICECRLMACLAMQLEGEEEQCNLTTSAEIRR